jgi:hypothetical protein
MARIDFRSGRTAHTDPAQAATELLEQLGSFTPKLVTLFAARTYDHHALNRALRERLPKGTRLIGASTSGEIDRRAMTQGQAVLGAFDGDFDVGIGLGNELTRDAMSAGSRAMTRACEELGTKPGDLSTSRPSCLNCSSLSSSGARPPRQGKTASRKGPKLNSDSPSMQNGATTGICWASSSLVKACSS